MKYHIYFCTQSCWDLLFVFYYSLFRFFTRPLFHCTADCRIVQLWPVASHALKCRISTVYCAKHKIGPWFKLPLNLFSFRPSFLSDAFIRSWSDFLHILWSLGWRGTVYVGLYVWVLGEGWWERLWVYPCSLHGSRQDSTGMSSPI